MLGVNRQLLQGFKKSNTSKGIAESFISMVSILWFQNPLANSILQAEFLKMYASYCTNQAASFEVLNRLKKDRNFGTFMMVTVTIHLLSLKISVLFGSARVPRIRI